MSDDDDEKAYTLADITRASDMAFISGLEAACGLIQHIAKDPFTRLPEQEMQARVRLVYDKLKASIERLSEENGL